LSDLNNEMQNTGLNLCKQSEAVSATAVKIRETSDKAAAVATSTGEFAEKLAKQVDLMKEDLSS